MPTADLVDVETVVRTIATVAVASTSAESSVRATLERAVGTQRAQAVSVFAGDVVPRKKPAPDIYLLALKSLGLPPDSAVVV